MISLTVSPYACSYTSSYPSTSAWLSPTFLYFAFFLHLPRSPLYLSLTITLCSRGESWNKEKYLQQKYLLGGQSRDRLIDRQTNLPKEKVSYLAHTGMRERQTMPGSGGLALVVSARVHTKWILNGKRGEKIKWEKEKKKNDVNIENSRAIIGWLDMRMRRRRENKWKLDIYFSFISSNYLNKIRSFGYDAGRCTIATSCLWVGERGQTVVDRWMLDIFAVSEVLNVFSASRYDCMCIYSAWKN